MTRETTFGTDREGRRTVIVRESVVGTGLDEPSALIELAAEMESRADTLRRAVRRMMGERP